MFIQHCYMEHDYLFHAIEQIYYWQKAFLNFFVDLNTNDRYETFLDLVTCTVD